MPAGQWGRARLLSEARRATLASGRRGALRRDTGQRVPRQWRAQRRWSRVGGAGLCSRCLPSGPGTARAGTSRPHASARSRSRAPGPAGRPSVLLGPARAAGRCPQNTVFFHVQLEIRNLRVIFLNLKIILTLRTGAHGGTEGDGPPYWVLAPGQAAGGLQVALLRHSHWQGARTDTQCPRAHTALHTAGERGHLHAAEPQPPDTGTEGPRTPGRAGVGGTANIRPRAQHGLRHPGQVAATWGRRPGRSLAGNTQDPVCGCAAWGCAAG